MSPQHFDVIVVGIGGHGSAALCQLAKRGSKVLGIEQFDIAHRNGSSHGLSRIIRLAYHEECAYVPLLRRSYELWRQLQQDAGRQDLLQLTGGIDAARPSADGYNGFERALESCRQHGLEHEVLSAEEVNRRFPGYHLPADMQCLYQPEGGILAPERCIEAHVAVAQQHGAQVHTQEKVLHWRVDQQSGEVHVTTDRGHYTAGSLVLTAGAWMPDMLPLQTALQVERQVIGWFEILEEGHCQPENFPIFVLQDKEEYWYGFPAYDHRGMKVGKFNHLREVMDPDKQDKQVTAADEECLRSCLKDFFPTANGKMLHAATCMFTNTEALTWCHVGGYMAWLEAYHSIYGRRPADHHFIVDTHPRHKQIVICSACSGHGYKFCSVMGEVLAELATTGSTQHDIEFLRINSRRPGMKQLTEALHGESTHIKPPSAAYKTSKL